MQASRELHFPLFDGVRGFAAMLVFTIHGVYQIAVARPEADPWWFRFAVHFDVAVPIFFAVSGFLLYRPFVSATVAGRSLSVKAYAWRRFLRIVPAYWVALAVITVWMDLDEVKSLPGVLRYGLFAQIYDPDTALKGLGQAWTLNVEVTYYAFLPLFGLVLVRARTIRQSVWGVLALMASATAWKAVSLTTQTDAAAAGASQWLYPLPAHLDQLGAGMLLAILSVAAARGDDRLPRLATRAKKLVERRPGVIWAIAFGVWVLCSLVSDSGSRFGRPITDPQYLAKHALYTVFVIFLLLPAVFGDRSGVGWTRKLLGWRPLAFVGTISYSFYLFHFAVIAQHVKWWGRGPENLPEWLFWYSTSLAGTLLLGALGFHLIEKRFMALGRLVPAGPRAPQVEAGQARAAP